MKKPKPCAICEKAYIPQSMTQKACSLACTIKKKKVDEDKKKAKSVGLCQTKTIPQLKKQAQDIFNKFIRLRDDRLGCISCGKTTSSCAFHAGHYLSVGAHPELRYEEDNVHKQCMVCNTWHHGNLIRYRQALINRIGVERVEWLEGPHEPKKYLKTDLIEIIQNYRNKIQHFKQNQ